MVTDTCERNRILDYPAILNDIQDQVEALYGEGQVASYIPQLGNVEPRQFGLALRFLSGERYSVGAAEQAFSIQSISKVFGLILIVSRIGEKTYESVGVEPSGDPFNSMVQLEFEHGLPRNPLINAGALVIADLLVSHFDDPLSSLLALAGTLAGNDAPRYDRAVAESERKTGFRNYALANMLKSYGRIRNGVEEVLGVYFHQCALAMSCADLANAFAMLANGGVLPSSGERILTPTQTRRINAIMQTCGFYDQAGEFAFRVGLPGKSGVGGGIAAIRPGSFAITVWSPELNRFGNSVLGMRALELFTSVTGESIF